MEVHRPSQKLRKLALKREEAKPRDMTLFELDEHVHVALRAEIIPENRAEQGKPPDVVPPAELPERCAWDLDGWVRLWRRELTRSSPSAQSPACAPSVIAILPSGMSPSKSHRVEVELPSEAFAHHPWQPDELSRELRELWLLDQVRQRRLAFTKAAELAGVPLAFFLERMRAQRITPFDLDPDEVALELQ